MNNKLVLVVGIALIGFGLFGKYSTTNILKPTVPAIENYVVDAPGDETLLEKARSVVSVLEESNDSTKRSDCLKLSALYSDIAVLIELDDNDKVIKDTASIREANSLAGKMLRLNIKNKYPNLAESCKDLIVAAIGEDDVVLDEDMRDKACDAFRALSWAFYEGSK